jgi:type IV secretion system protein VirD4
VPNVLAAVGSVVAVSTKDDVLVETAAARGRLGECLLYDPSGRIGCPPGVRNVGWSPLSSAKSWDGAVLVAEAMVGASAEGRFKEEGSHWTERASALLSTLFHAAALRGAPISEVVAAVNRRQGEVFLGPLARAGASIPLDLLNGLLATEERELSSIWSTASGVLSGFRTTAAQQSSALTGLDAERFVHSRSTLYIATSSEHQHQAAPLVAGVLRDVRSAAYLAGRRSTPPKSVLFVLDELANIAPLHDLPALVAEGASQGVLTIASLQDLSQARRRFGVAAEGFLTLFGTKVVLAGMSDVRTLEALSTLAGQREVTVESRSYSRQPGRLRRQRTRSMATRREPRLGVEHLATPPPGTATVFIGARAARVELTPHFSCSPWREASGRAFEGGPSATARNRFVGRRRGLER